MKEKPFLRKSGKATQFMVDGKPFVMLSGELHNSSGANLTDVAAKFDRMVELNLNSVIVPLSWELIEPVEGEYDFTLLDGIVDAARGRLLRLVFLWFGSWKNSKSSYAPPWVKSDVSRFPRVQINRDRNTDILTPFGADLLKVERRAFAATMRRIREIDEEEQAVLMVQVENEVGILGAPRDFSGLAEAAFGDAVPSVLLDYLAANRETLLPEIAEAWGASDCARSGAWAEVFPNDADEIFMAWHLASHIEALAAAGRGEHDIPMFVNAWLLQKGMRYPGQYPSGGPVSRMLDIWRAAAPHIEFLAPDIYVSDFKDVCESYTRSGNPLFIPETRNDAGCAASAFYAVGQHAALCFAPFAIDDLEADHPLGESYALLSQLTPMITEHQAEGRVAGFYQQDEEDKTSFLMGDYRVFAWSIRPRGEAEVPGGGLVIMLADDEFLAVGRNYYLVFGTLDAEDTNIELLTVDEGRIENGAWVHHRRLNGDETLHGRAMPLARGLTVCKAKLNTSVVPVYHQADWHFPR